MRLATFLRQLQSHHVTRLQSMSVRCLSMKRRQDTEPLPANYKLESIPIPDFLLEPGAPLPELDPMAYVSQPVTSAHMIIDNAVSARDSVAISPSGSVIHGRYGDLGPQEGIPLEYLALLRPAAEAAAATSQIGHEGTLLVFGATEAAGLAAIQLWKGKAVCAVVGGQHTGEEGMMAIVKGLTEEPSFAVPEEFAILKKNFADLVDKTVHGERMGLADPEKYLEDFKTNLMDFAIAFPDTRPAAVKSSELDFGPEHKDVNREFFRENIDPYLSQLPAGSPPLIPEQVHANFDLDQYSIFKAKFSTQTTAVITGDNTGDFSPAPIAAAMILKPEPTSQTSKPGDIPFYFSLTSNELDIPCPPAGPVAGAIIAVTSELLVAATALDKAKTKREKAEALQFLTGPQRIAYAAASSVVTQAKGKPVLVVGGALPGFPSVEPTDEHVHEALKAMDMDDYTGKSQLNFFIQVFRSGDYSIYEDYAVHRNAEGSPFQIIVTK